MQHPALPPSPNQPPQPELDLYAHRDAFHLRDLWSCLARQRTLVALCSGFVVAAVGAYTWWVAPVYQASASVQFEQKQTVLPIPDVLKALSSTNDVETELEVLRSRTIAEAVIDSLALRAELASPRRVARGELIAGLRVADEARPGVYRVRRESGARYRLEDAAGGALASFAAGEPVEAGGLRFSLTSAALEHDEIELRVSPFEETLREFRRALVVSRTSREAAILVVRYRSSDPVLVRDVPNAVTRQFIARRQDVQKTEVRSTIRFIQGQMDTLYLQLATAEDALRSFREGAQAVDLSVEATTGVGRLAELQAERGSVAAERVAMARLLQEVQSSSASAPTGEESSPYRRLVAAPALLRNQAATEMLRSLAAAEDQRALLLRGRSLQDPDVQILSNRIRELERQIHDIATTYLSGLTNQVDALDGSLAQFGEQLRRIPAKEVEFARLRRETAALEEIYALLQTRLKEAQIAQAAEDASVRVVDQAALPYRPVRPKPLLNMSAALFFGLLLGSAAALGRDYLDRTVRSRKDALIATGVPVLGLIPRIQEERSWGERLGRLSRPRERLADGGTNTTARGLVMARRAMGWQAIAEMYGRIHTNVAFARPDTEVRTLMVSSALAGEGKTTTATNLAVSMARAGNRVLLIDADMRRGCIHTTLGLPRTPGLAEVLQQQAHPSEAVQPLKLEDADEFGSLHVLTGGAPPPNPSHLLGSRRVQPLLDYLLTQFDLIIVDTPPINLVADAALLGNNVDGAVLVARAGTSRLEALSFAAEQLRAARVPLLGTVINDLDFVRDAGYDDAYQWYGKSSYSYLAASEQEKANGAA